MREPTIEELLKLLAEITGWSDQSLAVTVGYKRATDYDLSGDSTLNNSKWGFVVSTTICGNETKIVAQAEKFEEALRLLAFAVLENLESSAKRVLEKRDNAHKHLTQFIERHTPPGSIAARLGPYR